MQQIATDHVLERIRAIERVAGPLPFVRKRGGVVLVTLPSYPGKYALVWPIGFQVRPQDRPSKSRADAVAVIVHDGVPQTVMLTRLSQCHLSHLRVDQIYRED